MEGVFAHLLSRHFLLIHTEKLVALNLNKTFTIKDILLGCLLHSLTVSMENLNPSLLILLSLQDTFSMAVSFLSGKVVYVSPQGSSLLRCKTECLQGTVFSELLAPQDVSTFYSGTAPCRLPPWASCIGSGEQTLGDI